MALTLSQLEQEAPELLQQIRDQAREEALQAGREEGCQAERQRVMEILEAEGDAQVTGEAIKTGIPAAETFKLFFAAEKAKRGQALKDLESQAPPSLGQTVPPEPKPQDQRSPDLILAEMGAQRAQEKGLDLAAAMKEVAQENPELMAQWNPAAALQ